MNDHQLSDDEWDAVQNMRLDEAMRHPEPGHQPTIYKYIRCSHQDSVDSGFGLAEQEDVTSHYAELLRAKSPDLVISDERLRDEGVSAFKYELFRRPAGARLRRIVRCSDHVIFARIDRGFRNAADSLKTVELWQKVGITAHFIEENIDMATFTGPLVLAIFSSLAQAQAATTSERCKETARRQKELGRPRNGKCPPGWMITGKKGQRFFAPKPSKVGDLYNPLIIGELVRKMHDEEGARWEQIPEFIEQYRAVKAGRRVRPVPFQWGIKRLRVAYEVALKIHNGEPIAPSDPTKYRA